MYDYDVIVIGCGPAGQKAAIKCAKVGRKVALVDNREVVGGLCLHVGTIPSKTLREAIIYLSGYYERKIYGRDYRVKKDITIDDLLFRANSIIKREIEVIHDQLSNNGIEILVGFSSFIDQHTVEILNSQGVRRITTHSVVIATGSVPHRPDNVPFDGNRIMVTDEILNLKILPKRMIIVGGGVIALEYAAMFTLLDTKVTLVSPFDDILPFVDRDLVNALKRNMAGNGVVFRFNEQIDELTARPDGVHGRFSSGYGFDVELIMYAAPRWGATEGMNLDKIGIEVCEHNLVKVDEHYRTSAPHIYAAGDIIGFPSLASAAIDQGRKAANALLGIKDVPIPSVMPYGIYTIPEISFVGASEDELHKNGIAYFSGIGKYSDTARGQIIFDEDGLLKLLFDPDTRKLYGVHIIGTQATELIHIGQAVILFGGTINYFIDTVFNYPTLAEVYKIAALDGRNKLGYDGVCSISAFED